MRLPPPCNNVGGATEMGGIGTLGGAFGGTKVHRRMATLPDVAGVGCDRAQTPHHDEITTKCAKSRCATARHQPDGGAPVQEEETGVGLPMARGSGCRRSPHAVDATRVGNAAQTCRKGPRCASRHRKAVIGATGVAVAGALSTEIVARRPVAVSGHRLAPATRHLGRPDKGRLRMVWPRASASSDRKSL